VPATLTEEEVLEKMEHCAAELARHNEVPAHSVIIQGGAEKAVALLRTQPWFHMEVS